MGVLRSAVGGGGRQLWRVDDDNWRCVSPDDRKVGSALYSYGAPAWTVWNDKKAVVLTVDRGTALVVHHRKGVVGEYPLDGDAQGYPVRWSAHEFGYVADFGPRRGRSIVVVDVNNGLSRHVYDTPHLVSDLCVQRHREGGEVAWLEWQPGTMPWDSAQAYRAPRAYLRLVPNLVRTPGAAANLYFRERDLHGVTEVNDRFVPFAASADGSIEVDETFPGEGRSDWFLGWQWSAPLATTTWQVSLAASTTSVVFRDASGWKVSESAPVAIHEIDGGGDRLVALASDGQSPTTLFTSRKKAKKWRSHRLEDVPLPPFTVGEVRRTSSGTPFVYYEPHHSEYVPPLDERPGLIVHIHGGPTAYAGREYRYDFHYLVRSGWAIASVDYRGSTGYGAHYRKALYGSYGEADVQDVIDVIDFLVARQEVDPSRIFVRGGSSGGMTALLCAEDERVAGVIAYYPVTDALALHSTTHEAENGYLEDLIGPLPESAEKFASVSPQFRDRCPQRALIFQGDNDPVVPVALVRQYVDSLVARGVAVTYREFAGEGHGFRSLATRNDVLHEEISFLRS